MSSFTFNTSSYGPIVADLLSEARLPELGPGRPNVGIEPRLRSLTVDQLFVGRQIIDRQLAQCCRSALWLWHDFLDESHALSQEIATVEGSYWHGIMHRREPDYTNARYWFRRVRQHSVFQTLSAQVEVNKLLGSPAWDPSLFTDQCAGIAACQSDRESLAREVARLEWQVLFDFCFRGAATI